MVSVAVSSVARSINHVTGQKRMTPELLFTCAQRMGLQPSWITPHNIFVVKLGQREQYVDSTRSPLNSHISACLAQNKYITRLILERHNMSNIPFAQPKSQAEAATFLKKYGKIIAKPVEGWGAQDIHVITKLSELQALTISGYILEQYIVGQELRYLVLNGSVISVHRSDYGISVDEHRPLKRISYDEQTWDKELILSSIRIAELLNLNFAAVDYLIDDSGLARILEVNTTPGLKWFHAPTSGPIVDVAYHFMSAIVQDAAVS